MDDGGLTTWPRHLNGFVGGDGVLFQHAGVEASTSRWRSNVEKDDEQGRTKRKDRWRTGQIVVERR